MTSDQGTWRARCGKSRTPGSGRRSREPAGGDTGTAPWADLTSFDGISHQLCCQHLLRDLKDAAQSYPDAIWPGQIAGALRALIHAANMARDQGLAAVPGEMTAEHLKLFRHGVDVGLSQVRHGALPGSIHDLTAARELVFPQARLYLNILPFLADSGFEGAGAGVLVLVRGPGRGDLDIDTKTRNALLRSLRYQRERGFALMKQRWREMQYVSVSSTTIGDIAKGRPRPRAIRAQASGALGDAVMA